MKMTLHTAAGHHIEIEDEPAACAAFVTHLESERASRVDPAPPTHETAAEVRPYRGRTNRRHMVLEVLRALADTGNFTPSLDEIKDRFQQTWPGEKVANLDQVVRDLANKTDLVDRHHWGTFKLVQ